MDTKETIQIVLTIAARVAGYIMACQLAGDIGGWLGKKFGGRTSK